MENREFTLAQLKFLDMCLKNCQKDKQALKLTQEEKKKLKLGFNQTVEKIKTLMLNYAPNHR